MRYRPEIDGLRAVAVLPVLFFHAGFSLFSGGYVGVDVFFVISGYLITSIILPDIYAGTFSLKNFYERRARRILPALFLVVSASIPFAWLWLTPMELKGFSESVVAATIFLSNLFFAANSGYFERQSELQPLIHTWSLAVEEQFYIVFPLLVIALVSRKLLPNKLLGIIALLSIASLFFANISTNKHPHVSFFLSPTRAWELLLGALLAIHTYQHKEIRVSGRWQQLLSSSGLLMILYSTIFYNDQTPFPSIYTLVPTIGAVLVIAFANENTFAHKLLSFRVLVGIGLISYSLYLWHQPLFVFARIRIQDSPSQLLMGILIISSFALAFSTWKYVERPFRNQAWLTTKQVFLCFIAAFLILLAGGIAGHLTNGFEFRLTESQRQVFNWRRYPIKVHYLEGDCFLRPEQKHFQFNSFCTSSESNTLIWGDSHAAALASGWKDHEEIHQLTASGCPPILGQEFAKRPHCKLINNYISDVVTSSSYKRVLLHANWHFYDEKTLAKLGDTIDVLKSIDGLDVIIIGGVPQHYPSLPQAIVRAEMSLNGVYKIPSEQNSVFETDNLISSLANKKNVTFLQPLTMLCHNNFCQATIESENEVAPIMWDHSHLTKQGAYYLSALLLRDLKLHMSKAETKK